MELHDAEEVKEIRKRIARNIRMRENPQIKEDTF